MDNDKYLYLPKKEKKSVNFIMDLEIYKLLRCNFIHINNAYDI